MSFEADPRVQEIATAYSLDAVEFAGEHLQINLDWSDDSIQHIEAILGRIHEDLSRVKLSDEQVLTFAKVFGSYLGEVFRNNHGATWGMVTLAGVSYPGLQSLQHSVNFWPWGRAQNRILNGPEDNVWHYYLVLLEKTGNRPPAPEVGLSKGPSKKPWWRRLGGA